MNRTFVFFLIANLVLASGVSTAESSGKPDCFVWPEHGLPADRPVWGHRDGLRIGIKPTRGPAGLIRVYAPYLGQDNRVVSALDLWKDERLQPMGFFAWRTWPGNELVRTADARYYVQLSTDSPDPSAAEHDANVAPHWRYVGKKAIHYWRTEADAHPHAAVNGRLTYWMSQSPIPGGAAFENFELRMPFEPGRRLWFGVRPDVDQRRE